MNRKIVAVCFFALFTIPAFTQDPGWPRKLTKPGASLVVYQPQVDDWKDYATISWRQAFELTPTGGKPVIGAASMQGSTVVVSEKRLVIVQQIQVTDTYFPSLDPATSAKMDPLVRSFMPQVVNISLDRVVAYLPRKELDNAVNLKNDPPQIFVSYDPAILLAVDGEPALTAVPKTKLKFVVNTQWPVFFDTSKSKFYLLIDQRWFTATDLHGHWVKVATLPKEMEKLPKDPQWSGLAKVIPPPASPNSPVPRIFYSTVPAEVILFYGKPMYAAIPQTQLVYAQNTDSPLFVYTPTNEYYYLAAGRWFRARDLQGPWTFASLDLPEDFAKIPRSSPAAAVLASVPGTEESKDAVLIAQIPTVMEIDPKAAATKAKVAYTGEPAFAPIEGTSLFYATNTADKVIKMGDVYYLCLQGVWFLSPNASGPWTTASTVPKEIYSIPPSSPVYNVTYVTQTTTPTGTVQSSYTSGYLGVFVMGVAVGSIVANGTGYYHPPYIYYPPYGYPVYRPYPVPYGAGAYYNTRTGSYGVYQTAYGPYGSATRAASYNPYTGTYARGASAWTPYGGRSVGQAYNPYTGTYAASRQGSSPTSQWGQSYISNGNRSAYTQHYSDSRGTIGTVQGSQGGRAVGVSGAYGNAVVGRSSGGDVYAGHDGNVYKNTGNGWQKYDNSSGSWNTVNTPQPQQAVQPQVQQQKVTPQQQRSASGQTYTAPVQRGGQATVSASSMSTQNLNSEMQSRQRGNAQAQSYQRSGGSSGGWGSGGRSWSSSNSAGTRSRATGSRGRRR